jgi:HAD superfamily hydrolase (TIGR01450 family)
MPPPFLGAILDLDGLLESHGQPVPEAAEAFNELSRRGVILRILSNGALRSRRSAAQALRQGGFHLLDEQLYTISYITAAYLREVGARSAWVMTGGAGLDDFTGFRLTQDDPEYIVVGEYRQGFTFANLNHALRLLKRGAKLVGMDPELLDYTFGEPELNPGAWTVMLERASGVPAVYLGKPAPYCFELTLRSMSLRRSRVVMIGDQPGTDILGAKNAAIASILIRTGEYHLKPPPADLQPDYTFDRLPEILPLFAPAHSSM